MPWDRHEPHGRRWPGLALIAAVFTFTTVTAATSQGPGSDRSPAPTGADRWTHFAADLNIRYERLAADGADLGVTPPAMVMRLERRQLAGRWTTTFSLLALEPTWVHTPTGRQSIDNPFAITRIEYEDDGVAPRMYNRRGQLVRGPTPADIRALGVPKQANGRDWEPADLIARAPHPSGPGAARGAGDGFLVPAAGVQSRRDGLAARLGPPEGRVRGLDRFVSRTGDTLEEVLVNPDTALPIEINVVRQGRLASHARFDYTAFAGSSWLRRRMRHEELMPGEGGVRLVTDVELSNVSLSEGGR